MPVRRRLNAEYHLVVAGDAAYFVIMVGLVRSHVLWLFGQGREQVQIALFRGRGSEAFFLDFPRVAPSDDLPRLGMTPAAAGRLSARSQR